MSQAVIGPNIFVSMESRLKPAEALRELVDNAVDAGATELSITIEDDKLIVHDNGKGLIDLNKLMIPGEGDSALDQEAIGGKGVGGKDAMACFGRCWTVQSVSKETGKYYCHTVNWAKARRLGRMIDRFEGEGEPIDTAPAAIRNGGTIITVKDRRPDGFPRFHLAALVKRLELVFRPALRRGLKFTIAKDGEKYTLEDIGANSAFYGEIKELEADVAGMPFVIKYTALKTDERPPEGLSGLHIIYGPRVITRDEQVGVWIEVLLSSAWKTNECLGTSKDDLVLYEDELKEKVYSLLEQWLKEQAQRPREIRTRQLLHNLGERLTQRFSRLSNPKLEKDHAGDFGPKPRIPKPKSEEVKERKERTATNKRQVLKRRQAAQPGGEYQGDYGPQKHFKVEVDLQKNAWANATIAKIQYLPNVATVKVSLNDSNRPVVKMFETADSYAQAAVEWLVLYQIAAYVAARAETNNEVARTVVRTMEKDGYDDFESASPENQVGCVANWLIGGGETTNIIPFPVPPKKPKSRAQKAFEANVAIGQARTTGNDSPHP